MSKTAKKLTKTIPDKTLSSFCDELAMLLSGGCTSEEALLLLAGGDKSPYPWALDIADAMAGGVMPFHEALDAVPGLPSQVKTMCAVGEKSGRMEKALQSLAVWYEAQANLKAQAKTAILRPMGMLLLVLLVAGFIMTEILPVFDTVYASLGGGLSGPAAMLLAAGRAIKQVIPTALLVLLILAGLAILLMAIPGARQKIQKKWKKVLAKTSYVKSIAMAHTANAMAMGLASGLDTDETMDLVKQISEDDETKAKAKRCADLLASGEPLVSALKASGLFPKPECRVLELAMRSGDIDKAMARTAARLSDNAVKKLIAIVDKIEPVIVFFGAAISGAMLLAVMLPMMDVLSALGV